MSVLPIPVNPPIDPLALTLLERLQRAGGLPPRGSGRVKLADLMNGCRAAAAFEVPYEWDHGKARLDCACDIYADACIAARLNSAGYTDCPLKADATMTALRHDAADWRDAERRRRDHARQVDTPDDGFHGIVTDAVDAGGLTVAAALERADGITAELHYRPAGPLVYGLIRDGTSAEVAEELSLSADTLRKQQERARDALSDRFPLQAVNIGGTIDGRPIRLADALSILDRADAGSTRYHAEMDRPARTADGIDRPAATAAATPMLPGFAPERDHSQRWAALRALRDDARYRGLAALPVKGPRGWKRGEPRSDVIATDHPRWADAAEEPRPRLFADAVAAPRGPLHGPWRAAPAPWPSPRPTVAPLAPRATTAAYLPPPSAPATAAPITRKPRAPRPTVSAGRIPPRSAALPRVYAQAVGAMLSADGRPAAPALAPTPVAPRQTWEERVSHLRAAVPTMPSDD